ncbi:uncharacterized protein LOC135809096 [Sycon ciliatum]|uniref:uncharacterized protein LOC135809096 n=1 Tax=Sycon ciliatum TaxID=27933 RepID=UPI0031F704A2
MEWPPDILRKATDDFNDSNRIGEGGFGPVFSGMLWGTPVAIKVLRLKNESDFNERMAQDQYKTEVAVLTRFRHPNLVTLLGYSNGVHRHQQQCLVYEFMPNGSLEDQLDPKTRKTILDYTHRLNIMLDSARGLVFLHRAHIDMPLVHRDVKSANVLLDAHFCAKVGDFGLARDIDNGGGRTSKVMGTSGYIAPEYLHGQITPKIDVYAFGVVSF